MQPGPPMQPHMQQQAMLHAAQQPMLATGVPASTQQQPQKPGQQAGLSSKKPRRRVLTSLLLQVFLYFGGWWDVFYYVLNILVFCWKGVHLPYPNRNFAMEFSFSWLWFLIEIPRILLASQGNKTEHAGPLVFSFIIGLPLIGMYVYFIAFQTYVLKIDLILNGGALAFFGIQLLLGLVAILRFMSATRFS